MKSFVVAITGASGAIYGLKLIEELLKVNSKIYLIISTQAFLIIKTETGINLKGRTERETGKKVQMHFSSNKIEYYSEKNLSAPISSGSFIVDAMLITPCSMKTLSGIANGYANTLIERTADVFLKEGRRLILMPREMPLSAIHLENMLKLARLGVKIIPPIPAFYHKPKSIKDIVNFVVGKTLDAICIQHSLFRRWEL
ncbi:MAG: UbiX family flavin prenyltransferase [Nitrospirae bacterium]|nr:UbiX family flavin prenyltransferase [Nitrospirota bacterium]